MRARAAAAMALCGAAGCALDFDQFQSLPERDASVAIDVPALDVPPIDVPALDAPPPVDARPDRVDAGCAPPAETRVRVAHMAPGFGAAQLCMRRGGLGAWSTPTAPAWPARGASYADVTQHVALNQRVQGANESWQFALINLGASCNAISLRAPALATWSAQLDPQKLYTLLFTNAYERDGTRVGVLGLLEDKVCTDCAGFNVDVRSVHASEGSSSQRVNLAISYRVPLGSGPDVNQLYSVGVSYGGTASVGGLGYECDAAWWLASSLPAGYLVQLSAFTVGGDPIARSERVAVKSNLLRRTRMASVFFTGAGAGESPPPEFVLCYEGIEDAGMTQCDRIATLPAPDAGAPDVVDASPPDVAAVDAQSNQQDAALDDAVSPPDDVVVEADAVVKPL